MSKLYTTSKRVCFTDKQGTEARRKVHAGNLDYFYGDHWSIFEDKQHKCFIEFDVGNFSSKFVVRQISRNDYTALKNEKSLFNTIIRQFV